MLLLISVRIVSLAHAPCFRLSIPARQAIELRTRVQGRALNTNGAKHNPFSRFCPFDVSHSSELLNSVRFNVLRVDLGRVVAATFRGYCPEQGLLINTACDRIQVVHDNMHTTRIREGRDVEIPFIKGVISPTSVCRGRRPQFTQGLHSLRHVSANIGHC